MLGKALTSDEPFFRLEERKERVWSQLMGSSAELEPRPGADPGTGAPGRGDRVG